jgi:hypothetical protein
MGNYEWIFAWMRQYFLQRPILVITFLAWNSLEAIETMGDVNAIGSLNSVSAAATLVSSASTKGPSGLAQAATSGNKSTASISGLGLLLSNLEQLQTRNPDQFKQALSQVITQLQQAAQAHGQTADGQFLTSLANKLQNVANGGQFATIQPKIRHHHAGNLYQGGNAPATATTQSAQVKPSAAQSAQSTTTASKTAGSAPTGPLADLNDFFQGLAEQVGNVLKAS